MRLGAWAGLSSGPIAQYVIAVRHQVTAAAAGTGVDRSGAIGDFTHTKQGCELAGGAHACLGALRGCWGTPRADCCWQGQVILSIWTPSFLPVLAPKR